MKYVRSLLMVFLFTLFGFGALYIRYLILPFKKEKIQQYETLQNSWIFFINLLKKLKIIELEIKDTEKIKNIKNSIIVSTHPSFIDIVILMSVIPYSTCFVAAKLANNPFLKGMVNLLFIVDVESVEEWLDNACEKIDMGLNVIIFPMGGRHRRDECPRIRRGTALIAEKTLKDIVLLNIETSFDFLQGGQPFYEAGSSPVLYNIDYLGEIPVKETYEQYDDKVTFKTVITKEISKILYQHKKQDL